MTVSFDEKLSENTAVSFGCHQGTFRDSLVRRLCGFSYGRRTRSIRTRTVCGNNTGRLMPGYYAVYGHLGALDAANPRVRLRGAPPLRNLLAA